MSPLLAIEMLVANGDPATILELAAPHGAAQFAARILAEDPAAASEFDNEDVLAAYLRSLAVGQVDDARRAQQNPRRAPRLGAMPTPAAELHALTAEHRPSGRSDAPRAASAAKLTDTTRSRTVPTALPAPSAAVRLSLSDAGARFGMPLHRLPMNDRVRAALADHELDPRGPGDALTLDGRAVARLVDNREAGEAFVLRLTRAVPSLGYVGSGATVTFR
jgi:hypothetical protein